MESGPHGGFHVIHRDGLDAFEEILVDRETKTFFRKERIVLIRFIQNQVQVRPGSATPVIRHPDGWDGVFVL